VNKQREEHKQGKLTQKKIKALGGLGFEWGTRKGPEHWKVRYEELVSFQESNGHCVVPTKSPQRPELGRWVSHQRYQYKQWIAGKESRMTVERITKLDNLGFEWSLQDKTA
jgi:hypothetical protein